MLWVALHLPLLALESFVATLTPAQAQQPVALVEAQQVVAANAAARALGVRPGLKRATALALSPQILLGQAEPAREARALAGVAHAALAVTPMVCLQPRDDGGGADTVLLEVQASLRYFGGLTLEECAEHLGVTHRQAKGDWTLARTWLFQRLR